MANKTVVKKKRWTLGTLEEFIEHHGTQRAAAFVIGIPEESLSRVVNNPPAGPQISKRLHELGINRPEKKKWTGGTLVGFVKFHGTQEKAAMEIGLTARALNKILKAHTHPRGLTLRTFVKLKINTTRGLTKKG